MNWKICACSSLVALCAGAMDSTKQEQCLTFAMALHDRLGQHSPAYMLPTEIAQHILSFIPTTRTLAIYSKDESALKILVTGQEEKFDDLCIQADLAPSWKCLCAAIGYKHTLPPDHVTLNCPVTEIKLAVFNETGQHRWGYAVYTKQEVEAIHHIHVSQRAIVTHFMNGSRLSSMLRH